MPVWAASADFPGGVEVEELALGQSIMRVHRLGQGAVFFGPSPGAPPANRFDAPGGEYRALYAAENLEGGFVETLLRLPAGRIVRRAFVDARGWSVLTLRRKLSLALVRDAGLARIGVDASVTTTGDYAVSGALALRLHQAYPKLDGLSYRSKHNNGEVCYALYDRVDGADLDPGPVSAFKDEAARVDAMMARHGAVFDPTPLAPPP